MRAGLGRLLRAGAGGCLVTACLLTGCLGDRPEEPGVVAVVNGAPIRLAELEARHDIGRLGLPALDNPAVEELRAEYGVTLADLIVTRLVAQELTRLKLSPAPQELAEAEAAVRADYPGDAFERMLLEEHIDLVRWREQLAARLALERFTRDVLRPTVRVSVSEAASYYKEHIDAFTRPASVRLLVVSGRDAEAVKAALAVARKAGPGQAAPGVAQAVLPEAGLPAAWRDALKGLKPGEATQPLRSGREQVGLILVERIAPAVLDPAKAYARVEAMLASEKLSKAFAAWLAETLAGSTISINRQLLAARQPETQPATQGAAKAEQTEIETARAEDAARAYVAGQARKTLADKRANSAGTPTGREPAEGLSPPASTAPPAVAEEMPPAVEPSSEPGQPARTAASEPVQTAAAPAPADQPRPLAVAPAAAEQAPAVPSAEAVAPVPPAAAEPAHAAAATPAAPESVAASSHGVAAAADPAPTGAPAAQAEATPAQTGSGEVEFTAVKASWILYTVDEGREERVYLKPGKPQRIAYARRLVVRLGSPSEVSYRVGGRETTVEVGKKESRVLEFP